MVRETPFHIGHLRLMLQATEVGAVIFPPIPAFYKHPGTISDLVNQAVGRMLELFEIHVDIFKRWDEGDGKRAGEIVLKD
jgi:4-hydroxy-3-polyprenylbenzoate decarboxylase